ncbi:MAG: hypothetical protein M3Q52_09290 [Pseudomonadota bacterium]|nr:hypothetical protein [Pseudomonadota bacterium]
MRRIRMTLVCFALFLGGCDTAYGIRAKAEYPTKIDVKCVDGALRKAFDQVHRLDFVVPPEGTPVAQFEYYFTPGNEQGAAILRIDHVKSGTHVTHAFLAYDKLPQAVFPPARAAMRRAGDAVRVGCGLDLSNMTMREVGFFDAFRG